MLAKNLRRHRRERGFSQEELAHRAGIDRTYVSSLERQIYAAGIDVLERLALALGIGAADLLVPPAIERRRLPEHEAAPALRAKALRRKAPKK